VQARHLLSVIESKIGEPPAKTIYNRAKVSRLGRVVFLTAMVLLCVEPLLLLLSATSSDSFVGRAIHHVPILWLPLWTVFALWDAGYGGSYGLAGPHPDLLEAKGLKLSALGLTNVATALVFLIATKGR